MSLWLEYRPEGLFFRNGETVRFSSAARMGYSEAAGLIALDLDARDVSQLRGKVALPRKTHYPSELRRIEYSMLIDLPEGKETVRFEHFLDKGADVYLARGEDGTYVIGNMDSRRMFTKDRTVNDVTEGTIPSNRAVWQFHGYKHAH